jgi:hypothetical protein
MTCVPAPDWADPAEVWLYDIRLSNYQAIQEYRPRMLEAVHEAVEKYLNTRGLYFSSDDYFPNRKRMTGEYYLGDESYHGNVSGGFKISVYCRCLQKAWLPEQTGPDDYLGLNVWLFCAPGKWSFKVEATDSSAL